MSQDAKSSLEPGLSRQHPGLEEPRGPGLTAHLGAAQLALIEGSVPSVGVAVHIEVGAVPGKETAPGEDQDILNQYQINVRREVISEAASLSDLDALKQGHSSGNRNTCALSGKSYIGQKL